MKFGPKFGQCYQRAWTYILTVLLNSRCSSLSVFVTLIVKTNIKLLILKIITVSFVGHLEIKFVHIKMYVELYLQSPFPSVHKLSVLFYCGVSH